jgi:hypothetical protein
MALLMAGSWVGGAEMLTKRGPIASTWKVCTASFSPPSFPLESSRIRDCCSLESARITKMSAGTSGRREAETDIRRGKNSGGGGGVKGKLELPNVTRKFDEIAKKRKGFINSEKKKKKKKKKKIIVFF